jgi:hypothetical protein
MGCGCKIAYLLLGCDDTLAAALAGKNLHFPRCGKHSPFDRKV